MRYGLTFAVCVLAGTLVGCSGDGPQPDFPELHAVSGTVTQAGRPASGGMVTFKPEPDRPEFLINSEVGADGAFRLTTVRTTDTRGERQPGAPAGQYRVVYLPAMADQTAGFQEPVTLPGLIAIEGAQTDLTLDASPPP